MIPSITSASHHAGLIMHKPMLHHIMYLKVTGQPRNPGLKPL